MPFRNFTKGAYDVQIHPGRDMRRGAHLAELGWHTEKEDEEDLTTNVFEVRLSYSLEF